MSSANAVVAIPNQVPHVTSKGGVNQLTKVMVLAPRGIRANAIGPGSILTDILKVVMDDDAARAKILSRTPLGRCGEPEEWQRWRPFSSVTTPATSPARPSIPTAAGSR